MWSGTPCISTAAASIVYTPHFSYSKLATFFLLKENWSAIKSVSVMNQAPCVSLCSFRCITSSGVARSTCWGASIVRAQLVTIIYMHCEIPLSRIWNHIKYCSIGNHALCSVAKGASGHHGSPPATRLTSITMWLRYQAAWSRALS